MAEGRLWSTGPVACYLKHALDQQPAFLAYGERAPDIRKRGAYKPVHTDLSGDMVEHDRQQMGETATITIHAVYFSQNTLNVALARGRNASAPAITPGYSPPGSLGSFVQAESGGLELWLSFSYAQKAAFVGMPQGYHFHAVTLDEDGIVSGSSDPRKATMTFHATRKLTGDSNAHGYGGWILYDHVMAAIAGLPRS
jgi:hypothetical protein